MMHHTKLQRIARLSKRTPAHMHTHTRNCVDDTCIHSHALVFPFPLSRDSQIQQIRGKEATRHRVRVGDTSWFFRNTHPSAAHRDLQVFPAATKSSEEAQLSRWFSAEGQTSPTTDQRQQQQQQARGRVEAGESAGSAAAGAAGSGPSSLSSASSFQSLASSSLSSKSSSGICADSAPGSPEQEPRAPSPPLHLELDGSGSYANVAADLSGLDGLISACANINLNSGSCDAANLTDQEASFASAADDTLEADADSTQILSHAEGNESGSVDSPGSEAHEQTQAFRTCPAFPEQQTSQVAKDGERLQEQKTSAALSDESTLSSSGEPTVLQRTSNRPEQAAPASLDTGAGAEFKSALSSFAPGYETAAQVTANAEAILKFAGCGLQQKLDSPDVSFVEVENFNIPDDFKSAAAGETGDAAASPLTPKSLSNSISKEAQGSAYSFPTVAASLEKAVDKPAQSVSPEKVQIVSSHENELCNESEFAEPDENGFSVQSGLTRSGHVEEKVTRALNITIDVDNVTTEKENSSSTDQIATHQERILNKTQDIQESNLQNKSVDCETETQVTSHLGIISHSKFEIEEENQIGLSHQAALKDQSIRLNSVSDSRVANNTKDRINKSIHGNTPTKKSLNNSVSEDYQTSDSLTSGVVASTPLVAKNLTKNTPPHSPKIKGALFSQESNVSLKDKDPSSPKEERLGLDKTVAVNRSLEKSSETLEDVNKENLEATELLHNSLNLIPIQEPDYEAFKPQQQSTTLPLPNHIEFEVLEDAVLNAPKDIESSFKIEESEQFVSATTDLFGDPGAFDFLDQVGSRNCNRGERYDSLYMKFDPLAERASMLPQKNAPNSPAVAEEEIEKDTRMETPLTNINTPKKNPAIAAIDRLLFYSPMSQTATPESKIPEAKEEKEEAEKEEPPAVPVVDEKMAKELELVRSTMLQLEEDLRLNREQSEKQKLAYEEKVNQLQIKLTQEVKCKEQMTVVVEEYEKSISRLIAEREKDRNNFEVEKAKLQEELQVANQHLSNTEAAFSDVHTKYERLKNVISAYKSNEAVLKDSIIENQDTIKTLENRYEQLKSHAMAQLEKANLELSAIKKQNEAETVKLKAMVRKAELKSKSLEETVEQKTKENKELTQIIDEMIARVE